MESVKDARKLFRELIFRMNSLSYFIKHRIKSIFVSSNAIILILASAIFFFDRITKIKIINNELNSGSIFINDYLNIELVWNTGIGFGLFGLEAGVFYHLITFLVFSVVLLIIYFIIKSEKYEKYLYSIILGGALGNLYDRATYFAVPDFIDFHIENYHWFTFNIADIFISLGIILLLLKELSVKKK
ncbi:MAG: signal peptidase II [Pelagibacterales bacterium]|nr:signal peptidase II [Pelagibacterales bacterium]